MPQRTLRSRNGVVAFKLETTAGVDAAPATTDAMLVENLRITLDQQLVETNEMTGYLDPRAPIPGGIRGRIEFDTYLKGSGTAGVAPEFGDLFRISGWTETPVTAEVGAPTTVAAGASTSGTLASPAVAVAQAYRGMPVQLTGNPAAGAIAFLSDYTAARVGTLVQEFAPALSGSTFFKILKNVLYSPTSDPDQIKSGTLDAYLDGLKYKFLGCGGTFTLRLTAGQAGRISWSITGMFSAKTDAAVPAVGSFDATRPPVWRDSDGASGYMLANYQELALRDFSFDNGNNLVYPDNPNAVQGFDPTVLVSRRLTATLNPLARLVATANALADMQAGTARIMHARLGATAGNRVAVTLPAAQATQFQPGDRDGLMTEELTVFCSGEDAGAVICFF